MMRASSAILLLALTSPLTAEQGPEVALRSLGLSVRGLPPLLSDQVVAKHLSTGLTTSFVVSVEPHGHRAMNGEAQVRLRYDLWDERYVAERWDARRERTAPVLLAQSELAGWWRSLELLVWSGTVSPPERPQRAKVTLVVVPFSQAEQRDAQDWLLRSVRSSEMAALSPATGAQRPAVGNAPLRELYGAALAASIGRRSLITYSWTVPVTTESP
jgi:hypothetical protein